MASHVKDLGGAPGASICLRIFWNRMAFFCRFRVLGERTNSRSHACKQNGWLKSLGLSYGAPCPLLRLQGRPGRVGGLRPAVPRPRNLPPEQPLRTPNSTGGETSLVIEPAGPRELNTFLCAPDKGKKQRPRQMRRPNARRQGGAAWSAGERGPASG